MKKSEAIAIFGNGTQLAKALGLTKGRISQLPEYLDQATTDRVVGAAVRLEKISVCTEGQPTPVSSDST